MSFAVVSVLIIVPTYASDNVITHYQIQSKSLGEALNNVAQQAGVSLLSNAQQLNQYRTSPLIGHYTTQQAFEKLLKNTPFQIQKTPAGYLLKDNYANSTTIAPVSAATVTNKLQTE